MPPRRRQAAAPPLDGCTIALSGKFEPYSHSHASLEQLVRSLGAGFSKSVTKSTTHVVCTEIDYDADSAKVATGKAKDLKLVSPDWVFDVDSKKKSLDADNYTWASLKAANGLTNGTSTVTAAVDGSKKRSKVTSPADDEDQPKPKKARAPRATKAAKAASPAEDETQPKAKKTRAPKATKATKAVKDEGDEEEVEEDEEMQDDQKDAAPVDSNVEDEKVVAEGQFIKKKDFSIPRDEYCPHSEFEVYIDPDSGMIYDASLNQSNSSHNNNKFYRVQALVDPKSKTYRTWTRWGRVGETGQSALLGNGTLADAIKNFEKKFKDKSGHSWDKRGEMPKPGKYAFVERSYNPDDDDDNEEDEGADTKKVKKEGDEDDSPAPECTLEKPIKELMELIFNAKYFQNTMADLNYDANKLPLGKLSKTTITRGFQQLKDLAAIIDDPALAVSTHQMSLSAACEQFSNTYYSLIPHDFGRNRPPVISDERLLKKEIELLESLSDMKEASDIMKVDRKTRDTVHPLDRQFQGLGLEEMSPLDSKSTEFALINDYLNDSRGATHNLRYEVRDIFRIERQGETKRFANSEYAKIKSDRRLLWHGSRCTNYGGILSQGLRIAPPEAPVSGYMFGKGIYLADMSSKSANYCCANISNGEALLLLCEAELGDPIQKLVRSNYNAGEDAKKNGMYSTWGQGRTGPSKWMDAGAVHESLKGVKMPDTSVTPSDTGLSDASLYYNEFICYDVAQVKLRYLLRVKL